jgi:signal transduction histidine kinase
VSEECVDSLQWQPASSRKAQSIASARLPTRKTWISSHTVLAGLFWVQPRAFSDALCELLKNAIRASRRGYPVILDAYRTCEGDSVWEVQDLGDGISSQKLAELGHR